MEYLKIIIRQLSTPIFIIILVLSITLLALGERQDALFVISAIVFNMTLGIIQEIRARRQLHKLELMNRPIARLLVDGKSQEIDYKDLKIGDTILLELGDEVPADGEILKSSGLECNESMLTGESVAVKKHAKDLVYASSAVVAGSAEVRVTAVGDETRAGSMSAKLKNYDPQLTPLQKSLSRAIQYFTILAVLVGLIFVVVYWRRQLGIIEILKTITTAAVSLVPEGLLLASTVFLAYGSLRLTQARVLPQKLSAIESMALLDVLCIDKTGTLTSSEISFDKMILLNDHASQRKLTKLLGIMARETGASNATSKALADAFSAPFDYSVLESLPFSSERKMSAIKTRVLFKDYAMVMGAPEFVSKIAPLNKKQQAQADALAKQGFRVLLVAELPKEVDLNKLGKSKIKGQALALLSFNNELRRGVRETISFMQKNNISIRVISGDNPETVASIAKRVGIKFPDKTITGAELAKLDKKPELWTEAVLNTTIFARVLPEQKEKIVTTFQKQGLYVGMVGDGVNDALALKTADLGVAMGAGASASKRISDLILLDNAFTTLPAGMKLGSQIILSIEMVACLAFHKIFFGLFLSLMTLLAGLPYPFLPRHLTFMNIFLLTLPTLVITIFTPVPTVRVNPKFFWRDTLKRILPLSFLSALGIFLSFLTVHLSGRHGVSVEGGSTVAVLAATFFGMLAFYLTNMMFKTRQTRNTKLATISYVVGSIFVFVISFGWRFARNFFSFATPNALASLITVAIVALIAIAQIRLAMKRKIRKS